MRGIFAGVGGCIFGLYAFGIMLASFFVSMYIIGTATNWNIFAMALATIFAPVSIGAAPFYALIAWGNFFPLIINYGGFISIMIVGAILHTITGFGD